MLQKHQAWIHFNLCNYLQIDLLMVFLFLLSGVYIDQFHIEWYAKYDQLEFVHSYIQW